MSYTNEELVSMIRAGQGGNDAAYEELIHNLRPIMIHEVTPYRGKMTTYDFDDLIQECRILVWRIVTADNYKTGNFAKYYARAVKNALANLFRDYTLKNLVCIGQRENVYGNIISILVESDYAKAYREKHRRHCRESYERKKAALGLPEPKAVLTAEERAERNRARSLAYYHAHKDEINRKKKEKRLA